MALNNIIASRQQVQNSQGVPVGGGQVFLYEPGTTTFISAFADSGLVTPLTQPIRLSGSGRANVWITRDCDIRIEDRNGNLILTEDNANPDALGTSEIGGLVPNGSFEIDSDANNIPDGWTLVSEAGATNSIDTSESTDGAQSFRFTSSGSGGGSLTTTDFFPVNDVDQLRVNVDLRSTLATVRNIVRVEWYDVSQIPISNSDVYDSTANPTVFTTQNLVATPPALARFAKLRLIGIDPSVALAGSTYYDRVEVFYPAVVSGVFDNITIQNNEIITTNLNGDLFLRPNGTGRVVLERNGVEVITTADSAAVIASPSNGNPATPDALAVTLSLRSQDDNEYANLNVGSGDPGDLQLRNFALGGAFALTLNNSTGGAVDAITAGDDGVALRDPNNDETRLRIPDATVDDVHVYIGGTLNNNPDPGGAGGDQDAGIYFVNQTDQLAGLVGFDEGGSPDMQLANYVADGTLSLQVRLTGPNFRLGLDIDPQGSTDIYHVPSNAIVAQTLTPAAGGLQVNNTLTGAGLERVLTASDIGANAIQFAEQGADDTVNNSTTLVDTDLTFTNIPTGRYVMHGLVRARDVAVSGCGIRLGLTLTGVSSFINVWRVSVKIFAGSGTPSDDVQGLASDVISIPGLPTGSGSASLLIIGNIEVTSGTNEVTLQFAQNTAQVGDLDFETGSFLSLQRVGDV